MLFVFSDYLSIEKTLTEEVLVAPSSTHAQLGPYILLPMPIAEHIRSTVSRADVAVGIGILWTN